MHSIGCSGNDLNFLKAFARKELEKLLQKVPGLGQMDGVSLSPALPTFFNRRRPFGSFVPQHDSLKITYVCVASPSTPCDATMSKHETFLRWKERLVPLDKAVVSLTALVTCIGLKILMPPSCCRSSGLLNLCLLHP